MGRSLSQGAASNAGGRPRATTRRALAFIALELFSERGFDATSVGDIAERAGVSRRTFFNYFDSKAALLWADFDTEVRRLSDLLSDSDPEDSIVEAVCVAVLASIDDADTELADFRLRMQALATLPSMSATSASHYDAWVAAIAAFVAQRLNCRPDDLMPKAIGFSALGVCRAAFDEWVAHPGSALTTHLSEALAAWALGFSTVKPNAPGKPKGLANPRSAVEPTTKRAR